MSNKKQNHFHNFMELDSKKQSLKAKKIAVESYMIRYKKAKLRLSSFDGLTSFSPNILKEKEQLLSYVDFIDKVILALSKPSQEYFINVFLIESEGYNEKWWESKYSKVHYAKVRNYALDEFLMYVE